MMRRLLCFSFICGLLLSPILASSTGYALDSKAEGGFKTGLNQTNNLDTKKKCKDAGGKFSASSQCLDDNGNPFTGDSVATSIKKVINILLYIAGIIAVIYVVIGGFRYVLSNGDSGAITKAKNTVIYALIGLAVAVMAYAIVNFVLDNIVQP